MYISSLLPFPVQLPISHTHIHVHSPSLLSPPSLLQVTANLIQLMKDPQIQVMDSAAWTLGRVCEHVPEAVLNKEYLLPLLTALVEGLDSDPRVATNVCWVSCL